MTTKAGQIGWAVVTPTGKIMVNTVCADRESAELCVPYVRKVPGYKIKKVRVELVDEPAKLVRIKVIK